MIRNGLNAIHQLGMEIYRPITPVLGRWGQKDQELKPGIYEIISNKKKSKTKIALGRGQVRCFAYKGA